MATPYYDPETEGLVYLVQPERDDTCDQDDSDVETISSASTARTTSTITSDEIGDYFREAHGRIFPLDQNLPLIYPVDDIETRRHQLQHVFLKALMHGNYFGPVKEVLKPRADGSRPRILDIRTCAGDWAQDMATEFPHCDITSVDIAPINAHVPRANIAFEVYDLYAGVAEPDESFDYISCRDTHLAVREYDRLVFDLHRVLRPGGLITLCEIENLIYEADEPPYDTVAYRTLPINCHGIDITRASITKQGLDLDTIHKIDQWLQPNSQFWLETAEKYELPKSRVQMASRGFRDIQREIVLLPSGTWHPDPNVQQVGGLISYVWTLVWTQLVPLMVEGGLTQEQADEIASTAIQELQQSNHPILVKYHVVYGTKI